MTDPDCPYVSRGGLKLAAALDAFKLDVRDVTCADLGCSTGGFVDCLLQRGARRVYAVDTAYGELAWKLRQDERITVLQRTNALHFDPRDELAGFAGCGLVTIDLGWTRQPHALPAARRWLAENSGHIITLIKPHYEREDTGPRQRRPILEDAEAERVFHEVLGQIPALDLTVLNHVISPIRGGKGKGNIEYLAMVGV